MGLFGPKFKSDDKWFLSLKDFYDTIGKLLTEDKYISRKEYIRFCNDKANDFDNVITLRNNNTLNYWCKTTKSDPSLIDKDSKNVDDTAHIRNGSGATEIPGGELKDKTYETPSYEIVG